MESATGRKISLLLVVLFLAGCAGVAQVTGTATQDDILQLRTDLSQVNTAVQRTRGDLDTLAAQVDRRFREQAAGAERQALGSRLDALAGSLTELTNRVDELGTRVEALGRQLKSAAAAPKPAPAPSSQSPGAPGSAAPTPGAGSRPATGAPGPSDIYQAAYIDFSKGSYALAVGGFREFVRRYPEHELAGNAQYWIGEADLGLARGYANAGQADRAREAYEEAVQEFRKVIANHPRSEKASAALYKEALALIELKQPQLAQARLQYLVDNFPQAEEAPLARDRLDALKRR